MTGPEVKHFKDYKPEDGDAVVYRKGEAPGAHPKGTRVRKIMCEEGDGHKIGDLATVLASIRIPDSFDSMRINITDPPLGMTTIKPDYMYAVVFDGDNVPVHISSFKLEAVK